MVISLTDTQKNLKEYLPKIRNQLRINIYSQSIILLFHSSNNIKTIVLKTIDSQIYTWVIQKCFGLLKISCYQGFIFCFVLFLYTHYQQLQFFLCEKGTIYKSDPVYLPFLLTITSNVVLYHYCRVSILRNSYQENVGLIISHIKQTENVIQCMHFV